MISRRVSLSRDHFAAGILTVGATASALFAPLTAGNGAPASAPPTENAQSPAPPADTRPAIFADRVFVSNPGTHPIFVRPIIPGSPEAPEYPYPAYPGAQGSTAANAQWVGFSTDALAAAPADGSHGITVPAGAVAFPIEIVCVGLIIGGTAADTLSYVAYGSNKRA